MLSHPFHGRLLPRVTGENEGRRGELVTHHVAVTIDLTGTAWGRVYSALWLRG